MTVAMASASNATSVMVRTRPVVNRRRAGAQTPSGARQRRAGGCEAVRHRGHAPPETGRTPPGIPHAPRVRLSACRNRSSVLVPQTGASRCPAGPEVIGCAARRLRSWVPDPALMTSGGGVRNPSPREHRRARRSFPCATTVRVDGIPDGDLAGYARRRPAVGERVRQMGWRDLRPHRRHAGGVRRPGHLGHHGRRRPAVAGAAGPRRADQHLRAVVVRLPGTAQLPASGRHPRPARRVLARRRHPRQLQLGRHGVARVRGRGRAAVAGTGRRLRPRRLARQLAAGRRRGTARVRLREVRAVQGVEGGPAQGRRVRPRPAHGPRGHHGADASPCPPAAR